MKKAIIFFILALLILPNIIAVDLTLEKKEAMDVVVAGLDEPARFTFNITNNKGNDEFYFYNLLGFTMTPKEIVPINEDETKEVEITVLPRQDLEVRNYYTFPIYIRGKDSSEIEKKLTVKIIDLEDAFEIGSGEIAPESNSITIYILNKENFNFKDLNVKFESKFFEKEETFDLKAMERKEFTIELQKDDFKQLIAGFYTLDAQVSIEDLDAELEGVIKFVEQDIVEEIKNDYGFIVNTKRIQKTNNGNTVESVNTVVEKNIISRLFTSFSPEPSAVERKGATVTYTWTQEILPGGTFEVLVKTNWLYPFIILLFIFIIVVLVYRFTSTDVVLRKKISFVKAKGGEFALKVSIFAYAKKYVERVNIVDRLPSLMKLYQRFGGEQPSRINEKLGLIEWSFEKLEQGEVRTLSYIVYSKNVGVMGKFALPSAAVIYQKDGKVHEAESNKAFFMAEPKKQDADFE